MWSRNKPKQTIAEREWVGRIKSMPCICCDLVGWQQTSHTEAHEIKQGSWFTSIPLCYLHHSGSKGIHGDKSYLKLLHMDELDLLNETLRRMV